MTNMITGKNAVNKEFMDEFLIEGHQYNPDGNTLASGYGFDYVGHGQWGHAYVDKSGDTAVHVTRTELLPTQLGVMSNTQAPDGHLSYPLDHIRSYVMGSSSTSRRTFWTSRIANGARTISWCLSWKGFQLAGSAFGRIHRSALLVPWQDRR